MLKTAKNIHVGKNLEKQEKIVSMFDDIAPTYDKANRILSLGIDIKWRKKACNLTFSHDGKKELEKIVDVACGTGDMMGYWQKQADENGVKVQKIIGVDPSVGMMEVGKKKFPEFEFINSSATELPFEDESADIISISYGIRNVVKRQEALKEFHRVLKKGGYVVILEFTNSEKTGLLYSIRNFYLNKILPNIGGFISKNKEAYTYLPNSIKGFLSTEKMSQELITEGFEMIYEKGFSMDISTLFIAKKI